MIHRKKKYFFVMVFVCFFLLFPGTGGQILSLGEEQPGQEEQTLREGQAPQKEQASKADKPVREETLVPVKQNGAGRNENSADKSRNSRPKIAYLTFDDGPSPLVTPQVLEILRKYNIKASFFVIGRQAENYPEIVRKTRKDGHFIGNHTYSHNYQFLYAGPENFWSDVLQGEAVLYTILGDDFNPRIIRFPAGSFGRDKEAFRDCVLSHGYHYIDWNALNGDAEARNVPADRLVQRLKETTGNQDTAIILMHDSNTKKSTVEALPEIIEYLQARGYVFKTLDDYDF